MVTRRPATNFLRRIPRRLQIAGAVFAVCIGLIVSAATLGSFSDDSQYAAAASAKGGQCEQKYKQCMKDPKQKNKQKCEQDWKQCDTKKCKPQGGAGGKKQCPKDPDCEAACTEAATSKGGLLSCCQGGPKHQNSCVKQIDGKCSPKQTNPEEEKQKGEGKPPEMQMPKLPEKPKEEKPPQPQPCQQSNSTFTGGPQPAVQPPQPGCPPAQSTGPKNVTGFTNTSANTSNTVQGGSTAHDFIKGIINSF